MAPPGGAPRRGVLGIVTTRGDRLFISLLSAGYVHLMWLALVRHAAVGRDAAVSGACRAGVPQGLSGI